MPAPSSWWRRQYSREGKAWDRRSREPAVVAMREELVGLLAASVHGSGPLLDVGCGPGAYARSLPGFVVGTDLAPGMLEIAAAHGGVALVCSDLGHGLPFRDDAFTGLLALLVLQHVPDPAAAFEELRRVVTPEGSLLISLPAKSGQLLVRRGLYWRLRAWIARVPGLIHRFSEDETRTLFAGFDVVELRHVGATYVALVRNRSEVP